MSVICQNFVQNAWKKDLCSNCFKSVGDHDINDSTANEVIQSPNQSENLSIRYVSQASNVYSQNTTPHTTWKSVISERNTKNSQPFKLETGFQGRLLTINKASHGIEKRTAPKANLTNGNLSDSQTSSSDESKITSNGHVKTLNGEVSHFKKNSQPVNGYSVQNGNNCHRNVNTKVALNGSKLKTNKEMKNAATTKACNGKQKNKEFAKLASSDDERLSESKKTQSKLVKSKSEDTLSGPLHGILKKNISSPAKRRISNVGFKEEEPLVIGYGGRDFSPEELEWDMNTSDVENEDASDSLDETEDDKAFSKMTKQNTEFNSDNANLLQKNADKSNKSTKKECWENNQNQKESTRQSSQTSETIKESAASNFKNNAMNESKNENSVELSFTTDEENDTKQRNDKSSKDRKGSYDDDESNSQNPSAAEVLVNDVELGNRNNRKNKNDSANVSIKSDKTNHVVSSGEVTVVETAKVGDTRSDVKNSSEFGNDALPPSTVIPAPNINRSDLLRLENSVMYSDGEGGAKENTNALADENNEWQDDDGMAGQILQAINTSLTNRHKMNDGQKMGNNYAKDQLDIEPAIDCIEVNKLDLSTMDNPEAPENVANDPTVKIGSSDDEVTENGQSMEPRTSFLHGIAPNSRPTNNNRPSAIYGPASDLFVSRSNSSSSSSSDELSKSEISHSINVIVNGKNDTHQKHRNGNTDITESENDDVRSHHSFISQPDSDPSVKLRAKPKLPAKPLKQPARSQLKESNRDDLRTKSLDTALQSNRRDSDSGVTQNDTYYSVSNASIYSGGPKSISLVDHYAESNIYHEVENEESKLQESEHAEKAVPRESKLAALAMELEQVRHCNGNTKRQAPAPPKIPDPPLEDPPNCTGRTSPPTVDAPLGFSSFRGEAMAFSSSSSTTSTSSQDTETGYASWNLQGDGDDLRKHPKSKSSFLLTQYSKCKMLAMGYAEDSAKSRKKFSLKKLLKIRKESEAPAAFDPNCPNPKAWKYSDQFDRPRAKLEIIHPMDLENKSVTVNPGFDSLHSGSMSSFSASADDLSLRNSVSSDYGSFYSDTVSPMQDLKSEVNYESIQSRLHTSEHENLEERNATGSSNSPTPSRSSSVSQASTLTSGSSKNGGTSPYRPPKPPPPPRAHSLLPGNKTLNPDGTFKFPVVNCNAVNNLEIPLSPTKPQAPKRQCKPSVQRTDCGIYDNNIGLIAAPEDAENLIQNEPSRNCDKIPAEGNIYGTVLDIRSDCSESHNSEKLVETIVPDSPKPDKELSESQVGIVDLKSETQSINVTVKATVTEPNRRLSQTVLSRNKHSPVTKAPARPPPIYMKSQMSNVVKNPNPWKTLEDSYLVLTAANRELLVKLVNQALKKRKNFLLKLQKIKFQWSEFEIDVAQPSAVFAFGEKIAYHATMPRHPEYSITLVVTIQQQQHSRLNENNELKYPVFGQFIDYIPPELLDNSSDAELESMQATVLVLDRSNISTIECFTENLPNSLSEENEKELCFIILQLIHSLKSLQVQGIESIDSSFQNLILAKSKQDKYNTLVFLYDNCYEENDYMSDSCKISLCQYALMLLFQLLSIQTVEEFYIVCTDKFSSEMAKNVFEGAIAMLSEEKAVSLSQTKTLFECFLWELTRVISSLEDSDDIDSVLHRWFDIKRSNYIKSIIDEQNPCDINIQLEYYSQFLLRTSVRNIKEVASYL